MIKKIEVGNDFKLPKSEVSKYRSKNREIAHISSKNVYNMLEKIFGANFDVIDLTDPANMIQRDSRGQQQVVVKLRFVYFLEDESLDDFEQKQRSIDAIGAATVNSGFNTMAKALNTAYTSAFKNILKILNVTENVHIINEELLGDSAPEDANFDIADLDV